MIPKVIHYCWFGGKKLPKAVVHCIESWKKFCPDYEIIEWNESNYDVSSCKYMKEAYEKGVWGFVPDYARFDIIFRHGGIYLDTDVELKKSLDPLLRHQAFMGRENREYVAAGLGFGAVKNHSFMEEHRDFYNKISFLMPDGSLNLVASPQYTTALLIEKGLSLLDVKERVGGVTIYPCEYFSPMNCYTGYTKITPKTYSIHWYSGSWLSPEEKKKVYLTRKIFHVFGLSLGKQVIKGMGYYEILKSGGAAKKILLKIKKMIRK